MNEEHYVLPEPPELLWWLPPPCHAPTVKKLKRRFSRLVRHLITNRLKEEAGLDYENRSLHRLMPIGCRSPSPCQYQVQFYLGQQYPFLVDAKRAIHDLEMFAPRGVQRITPSARQKQMFRNGAQPEESLLEVNYIPNCKHNVRFRGNSLIRTGMVPKVAVDGMILHVPRLNRHAEQAPPDPENYTLPNCARAEWWLCPPCKMPIRKEMKKRFTDLVKYMLASRLQEEAGLNYPIQSLSIQQALACKTLSQCLYNVTYAMSPQFPTTSDAKRALNDLRMFCPRGVQHIEAYAELQELVDTSTEDSDESETMTVLKVTYFPNCQHN